MNKKFFSVSEAAKIIGVSTNTIYKYLDDGSLKGKRLGGRGRFKVPYSELAPYLSVPSDTVVTTTQSIPSASSDVQVGVKTPLVDRWMESVTVILGAFFILWGTTYVIANTMPSIGEAVLNYSGRTFSGFGSIVTRFSPKESIINPVASVETAPPVAIVPEPKTEDFSSKTKDAERLIYDLYVNSQTLSASSEVLLGKSKTLTVTELNDTVKGMFDVLGSISGQLDILGRDWNFPALTQVNRTTNKVNTILDSLKSQSLSVFSKPELKDLTDLVYQVELLQRLVGNTTDTQTNKTVFGNLKLASSKILGITDINLIEPVTNITPKATSRPKLKPTIKPSHPATVPAIISTPVPSSSPIPRVFASVTKDTFKSDTQKVLGITVSALALIILVVYLTVNKTLINFVKLAFNGYKIVILVITHSMKGLVVN